MWIDGVVDIMRFNNFDIIFVTILFWILENLFQLSQKYLVTVGLFQTGSKLSCHIIFNCDIVLTFFF